jgi:hypothetical protein
VWSLRTSTGTVVLVAGGRAAVALSEGEHLAWAELDQQQTVDGPTPGSDPASWPAAMARLAGIGAVVEAR